MARQKKSAKAARLATLAVQTKHQKEQILEQLKKTPIVQTACAKAGVGHSTYYAWRKTDKIFAAEADRAKAEGKSFINDMAESQLIRKIGEGHVTAIIYWLKNNHADYTDTIRYLHEHEHNHRVEISKEERDEIFQALQNIGLASILKTNGDPRNVEKYRVDTHNEEEQRQKELGIRKKGAKLPSKGRTLGERLAEESEDQKSD